MTATHAQEPVPAQAPSRTKPVPWTVLVCLAAVAALWPVCLCGFTSWDDFETVARNPRLNLPTWAGLAWHWRHPYMDIYIPLTHTAWAAIAWVSAAVHGDGPLDPHFFHAINLLVHLAAAAVVFRFIKRLLRDRPAAAVGALVFAIHPIQVEAVAWVSGLKDVLCGFLSLVALWQYVVWADGLGRGGARWRFGVAAVAVILAMLAKPSAVVVPLVAGVVDWWVIGRPLRKVAVPVGLLLLIVLPLAVVAKVAQPATDRVEAIHAALRPLVATDALAFYLYKLAWPLRLGIDYGRTPTAAVANGWVYWTWLVPATIAAGVVWLTRTWGKVREVSVATAGAVFFAVALLPVLGLVPFDFQAYSTVADHYVYFAMAGFAMIAAAAFAWASRHLNAVLLAGTCATVLLCWGLRTCVQTWTWRDSKTLFEHALHVNPRSWPAHNSLAAMYVELGQPQKAIEHANAAIAIRPNAPMSYLTLGNALLAEAKIDPAVATFGRALQVSPNDPKALNNLAGALAQQGKVDEAMSYCRRALSLAQDYPAAHTNLGTMLAQQGQWEPAIAEYETAVRLDPAEARAQTNLGVILAGMGRFNEAATHFRAALRLDPANAVARQGLAEATAQPAPGVRRPGE
jgi:Flp pilus assembly protein TadD